MSDLETKVSALLHDLVFRLPPPGQELGRQVLRRARRRRAANVSLSAVMVAALVVGGVSGLRAFRPVERSLPGSQTSTPSPIPPPTSFQVVWPETNADDLAAAQAQVDLGHQPWRLDPTMTAAAWAVNLLGWDPARVETLIVGSEAGRTTVSLRNGGVIDSPRTVVELGQLGTTGPYGIWSVAGSVGEPIVVEVTGVQSEDVILRGGVTGASVGSTLSIVVLDGPTIEDAVGSTTIPADPSFATNVPVTPSPGTRLTLLARLVAPDGQVLAGTSLPLASGSWSAGPVPTTELLPPAVAATRGAVLEAARNRDLSALSILVGPMFSFDFGVPDPIRLWRNDPAMLDTIVKILDMPFAINDESTRRIYEWPSFTQTDLSTLTPSQLRLLSTIGVSERDVESMVGLQTGYIGPRLGISADGIWMFFVTSGD